MHVETTPPLGAGIRDTGPHLNTKKPRHNNRGFLHAMYLFATRLISGSIIGGGDASARMSVRPGGGGLSAHFGQTSTALSLNPRFNSKHASHFDNWCLF